MRAVVVVEFVVVVFFVATVSATVSATAPGLLCAHACGLAVVAARPRVRRRAC
jgi:hypothetical protein